MTTNDRLKVFLIGVPGGALLIAGLLSINSAFMGQLLPKFQKTLL